MAAASNESFGLKIATAFSIALAVVLLVVVYFLNSNYNLEAEKNVAAQKKIGELNNNIRDVTTQANDLRAAIGYPTIEDPEAFKAQMKKDNEQIKSEISAIKDEISTIVADFQKKIEGKGVDASQFEVLKQRAREVVDDYVTNPDQSYKAALNRLTKLTVNQAKLTTNVALNYIDLRRDLELANKVNSDAKKQVEDAFAAAKAELDATIKKDEELRSGLVADVRDKSDKLATAETNITNITNDLTGKIESKAKIAADLKSAVRDLQDVNARKENVMSKPGGRVTYVDYGSKTVRVNVNRAQGVRPLMRFTIFDKNASAITSDKPKAAVELIKVGDPQRGENDSLARIVSTYNPSDPIRYNDYIFSVGWSYDHPQRFALIGKLDVNRDGRDDRNDLIRMIEASGGVIEFDLPPPGVDRTPGQAAVTRAFARLGQPVPASVGRAAGKISGLTYAYVTDNRPSLILNAKKAPDATKDDTAFLQEESAATREARDNGIRPLPLEKLLNMLGYEYTTPIEGRRDGFDKAAAKQLLKPKAAASTPSSPGAVDASKEDSGAMPAPADSPK